MPGSFYSQEEICRLGARGVVKHFPQGNVNDSF
jgi:hypothetical protein